MKRKITVIFELESTMSLTDQMDSIREMIELQFTKVKVINIKNEPLEPVEFIGERHV